MVDSLSLDFEDHTLGDYVDEDNVSGGYESEIYGLITTGRTGNGLKNQVFDDLADYCSVALDIWDTTSGPDYASWDFYHWDAGYCAADFKVGVIDPSTVPDGDVIFDPLPVIRSSFSAPTPYTLNVWHDDSTWRVSWTHDNSPSADVIASEEVAGAAIEGDTWYTAMHEWADGSYRITVTQAAKGDILDHTESGATPLESFSWHYGGMYTQVANAGEIYLDNPIVSQPLVIIGAPDPVRRRFFPRSWY